LPLFQPVQFSLIEEDAQAGIGLYRSGCLPDLWIPLQDDPGCDIDRFLFDRDVYHNTYIGDLVSRGDNVLDCGGYIGLFTLWCLDKGAGKVVVFEPEKRNCECIRRNLSGYIGCGRVVLVEKGVWSSSGEMVLNLTGSGVGHSLLDGVESAAQAVVEVAGIDDVMRDLEIDRIDFIKMDIEGAEREALIAAKNVIYRNKPKMFICTYHLPDDHRVITERVLAIRPDYSFEYTGFSVHEKGVSQNQGAVFT